MCFFRHPDGFRHYSLGAHTKRLSEKSEEQKVMIGLVRKLLMPGEAPRTEYSVTPSGKKLIKIIRHIQDLDVELKQHVDDQ